MGVMSLAFWFCFFSPPFNFTLQHDLTYDREPQCSTAAWHLCGDFILFFIFSFHPMISKYLSHRVGFPTFVCFPCFCEFFLFFFVPDCVQYIFANRIWPHI